MFALSAYTLRTAHSYEAIADLYRQAHAWRGDAEGDPRSLSRRTPRRYLTIRPVGASYALKYHGTDVVTWHSPERFTVKVYASRSTETFADSYIPWNLRSMFNYGHDDGFYMRVALSREQMYFHGEEGKSARVYEFKDRTMNFALDKKLGCFVPVDAAKITFIDSSAPALRTALTKTNYFDFAKWIDAVMALERLPLNNITARGDKARNDRIVHANQEWHACGPVGLLADPNKWGYLADSTQASDSANPYSTKARAEAIKSVLREYIYREFDAIKTHEVDWIEHSQFQSQRAARAKYHWV